MDKREILHAIAAEAARGELVFPTHADVALRVQRAMDDPDCSVDQAARLIQAEPVLAARIVAMANSVAFNRSGRAITDVRLAVSRLGFRTVKSLATALAVRQMAVGVTLPAQRQLATQLWEHTAHVAALAHVIARRVTRQDPETALFAGLVHEVGGFYLLSKAKDYPGLLDGELDGWQDDGEAEVGRAVLRALAVPEAVATAVDVYWQGYLALPPITLGDTLLLADDLAPVRSPLGLPAAEGEREDRTAAIDMVVGEDTLSAILKESAEEVESLTGALKF